MKEQLESYVTINYPLHSAQHGFTAHQSTITNLLVISSIIVVRITKNKLYDVVALDFHKVFDKIPQAVILSELCMKGVEEKHISGSAVL